VYAYGGRPDWLGGWTVFYWAWWIAGRRSWACSSRASRGRTIREFVFGVLLIPLGFTLAWMSIFGNSAAGPGAQPRPARWPVAVDDPSMSCTCCWKPTRGASTVIAVTVFISFVFFVTSADSGTVVLSTLSAKAVHRRKTGRVAARVLGRGDRLLTARPLCWPAASMR
jgi:choline/glycine/proline betaine transport protein